ncbi:histidine phosphatase family protein [Aeromicrobium sp. 179-A 4D2 NHS]|uniref:histidine phosphatase family protein n=1 Tax=Aeromicrobium sp. 179-A 4D2 NHS TaxID=3142375 RepID=UPI0039A3D655
MKPGAVAGRRVILWRHGRTEWNLAGRVQGQTDIPLDAVGRQQAVDAAARLAALMPSRIVSSDLSRAFDTASALGAVTGLEVEIDVRLRELAFGAREGLTWRESWERFPAEMQAWADGDETQIEGAETHAQAGARLAEALREHLESLPLGETLVLVAHGAVLRTGILSFLGIAEESWRQFGGLSNCHWSVLEESRYEDWSQWRLAEWNSGSLPEPVMSDDEAE